jgi:hypothetical protein
MDKCCKTCKYLDYDHAWETDYGLCVFPLPEWIKPGRVLAKEGKYCLVYESVTRDNKG